MNDAAQAFCGPGVQQIHRIERIATGLLEGQAATDASQLGERRDGHLDPVPVAQRAS